MCAKQPITKKMNNSQVLGQRTRKTNIDTSLAERVNAEVAEENRRKRLEEKQRPVVNNQESSKSSGRTLRLAAPFFRMIPGNGLNISELTDYLEDKERSVIPNLTSASMADYYAIFKKAKDDNNLLRSIRIALSFNFPYISSTIVEYSVSSDENSKLKTWFEIDGGPHKIIHHYGSNDKNIVQESEHYVMLSSISNLPSMLNDRVCGGEAFIKNLFGTNDDADAIIDTLESAFGIDRKYFIVEMEPFKRSYSHLDKLKYETIFFKMKNTIDSKLRIIISATNPFETTKGRGWGVYYE